MDWKDIKSVIGKAAPVVGTLFGGPAGAAIGGVVGSLLGVEDTPEAISKELKTNPEALLKLKEYELAHAEKLQEMQLETMKTELADVADARSRQEHHEEVTGKTDINLYVLAWTTVIGFFSLIGILMFMPLPTGSENLVYLLLGALTGNTNSVYQYFFGTSKGSSDKNTIITKMQNAISKK